MSLSCNEVKSIHYIGKNVKIRGWVYRLRKQKKNSFILVRDSRNGIIQAIFPTEIANRLTIESSIEIEGLVKEDPRAPEGGYEIAGTKLKIFNIAQSDFPIGEYQSTEILLGNRHLALRSRRMIAMARIRSLVLKFARQWFSENCLTEITPPILVKGAVEGGSTLFKVDYFDEVAFLSQSAQLYLEAMIFCLGPVWCITPSFRAEKSRTIRHLTEFTHLEAELPWASLEDILKIQERLISSVVQNVTNEGQQELSILGRNIECLKAIEIPFDRLSYERAIEQLRSKDYKVVGQDEKARAIEWGDDLNIESERELTKDAIKPLFVIGYPIQIKPFYVKEDPLIKNRGLSLDMLAPQGFGEISTGGLREDDLTKIKERIKSEGLILDDYEWYLDLRRYGSIPHGGFGIGIERLVRWITNIEDIKDTCLFPRTPSRLAP
ncbi:MAG TPA: asparagine--tRNA ligase [Nitrososphaeraceae archaeon]|nr:asparagine--tRNA ligase [Nitrososphaeraceae archaeon]